MDQLVILSGKGGTGKTSICGAFAHLFHLDKPSDRIVIVDADVDAANRELILETKRIAQKPFMGGLVDGVDSNICNGCGTCQEICRLDAVRNDQDKYWIDPIACEGCAACVYQCLENAISLQEQLAGEWYISGTPYGRLFHARLYPAQENSGKLVALVKEQAKAWNEEGGYQLLLVDGPPGIGCPVISVVSGADAALIVTEPSLAGIHDLSRALDTTAHFDIPAYVCINKADLYDEGVERIKSLCSKSGIDIVGEIPFDLEIPRAMIQGVPVTKLMPDCWASQAIEKVWENLFSDSMLKKRVLEKLIQL